MSIYFIRINPRPICLPLCDGCVISYKKNVHSFRSPPLPAVAPCRRFSLFVRLFPFYCVVFYYYFYLLVITTVTACVRVFIYYTDGIAHEINQEFI